MKEFIESLKINQYYDKKSLSTYNYSEVWVKRAVFVFHSVSALLMRRCNSHGNGMSVCVSVRHVPVFSRDE